MNLLLPPPIAAVVTLILGSLANKSGRQYGPSATPNETVIFVIGLSYLCGIIPSATFMAAMEWLYKRGLSPKAASTVGVSILCSALSFVAFSGVVVGVIKPKAYSARDVLDNAGVVLCIGTVSGFIVGILNNLAAMRATSNDAEKVGTS